MDLRSQFLEHMPSYHDKVIEPEPVNGRSNKSKITLMLRYKYRPLKVGWLVQVVTKRACIRTSCSQAQQVS